MRTLFWPWRSAVLLFFVVLASPVPTGRADPTPGLRILTAENPPLNFRRNDRITGLSAEVVGELMKRTDTAGAIEMMPWPEAYEALSRQANVALFSTVMTAERNELLICHTLRIILTCLG